MMSRTESAAAQTDIVDLAFRVSGGQLPVEHAHALGDAVLRIIPWMGDEPRAGVHDIHVAASSNGWMRPDADSGACLSLSRRTRLVLRVPAARVDDARVLEGARLRLEGYELEIGPARPRELATVPEQHARRVATTASENEATFLERIAGVLAARDIPCRTLLCGRSASVRTGDGLLPTRSLLVGGLTPEQARDLQREPLGEGRLLGCGLFVPHKGIDSLYAGRELT